MASLSVPRGMKYSDANPLKCKFCPPQSECCSRAKDQRVESKKRETERHSKSWSFPSFCLINRPFRVWICTRWQFLQDGSSTGGGLYAQEGEREGTAWHGVGPTYCTTARHTCGCGGTNAIEKEENGKLDEKGRERRRGS